MHEGSSHQAPVWVSRTGNMQRNFFNARPESWSNASSSEPLAAPMSSPATTTGESGVTVIAYPHRACADDYVL